MHGAWYVSPEQIRRYGRLGRSWGCPALSQASAHPVIDTIKGGSFVFAYAADPAWRQASSSRRCTPGTPGMPATPVIAAVATGSRESVDSFPFAAVGSGPPSRCRPGDVFY